MELLVKTNNFFIIEKSELDGVFTVRITPKYYNNEVYQKVCELIRSRTLNETEIVEKDDYFQTVRPVFLKQKYQMKRDNKIRKYNQRKDKAQKYINRLRKMGVYVTEELPPLYIPLHYFEVEEYVEYKNTPITITFSKNDLFYHYYK